MFRGLSTQRASTSRSALGVALPLVIGSAIGLLAGYFGRWADILIGRLIDIVIAFPFLVLIAIVAMSARVGQPYRRHPRVGCHARILRGETLALKARIRARCNKRGLLLVRIMFRHILPMPSRRRSYLQ